MKSVYVRQSLLDIVSHYFGDYYWLHFKTTDAGTNCACWCGSVDWALACELKGCWFNSLPGHMPGLWARPPVGGV